MSCIVCLSVQVSVLYMLLTRYLLGSTFVLFHQWMVFCHGMFKGFSLDSLMANLMRFGITINKKLLGISVRKFLDYLNRGGENHLECG